MIGEIEKLLRDYQAWLKDKTVLRQINEWVEITTPYLDRHNDYVQIYARKAGSEYLLTDDGLTIRDLEQGGCRLDSPKRRELLDMTLRGFGVRQNGDQLTVQATENDFGLRKHNLLQAILAVNDLFYLAEPYVASLFYEQVVGWLDLLEVRYTPKVKFTGKSGLDHMFHFVIPKSRARPERLVTAISHPSRDTAQAAAFAWLDTKDVRPPDALLYAILNDSSQPVPTYVMEALRSYSISAVNWSQRATVSSELLN